LFVRTTADIESYLISKERYHEH